MARTSTLGFLLFVALATSSSAQDEGGVGPSEDLSEVINLWFNKLFFKKILFFRSSFGCTPANSEMTTRRRSPRSTTLWREQGITFKPTKPVFSLKLYFFPFQLRPFQAHVRDHARVRRGRDLRRPLRASPPGARGLQRADR